VLTYRILQVAGYLATKSRQQRAKSSPKCASVAELCADQLVVGGGVGWSYDRRRRRAAHFSSAAAAWLYVWSAAAPSAASDRMREH